MEAGTRPAVTVFGARGIQDLPGLAALEPQADVRFSTDEEGLAHLLPGTDVVLVWDFRARVLERLWPKAGKLRWVHWASAGVDAALFPGLRDSDVILTNARGVFDHTMAEYVLGLVLCFAKDFPRTVRSQDRREWNFRYTEPIQGKTALLVGTGNIGRAIGAMLRAAGMTVIGVARSARAGDPVFGDVRAFNALDDALADADYVINITPSTPDTRGLFSADRFGRMKPGARFINVGRGDAVVETDLEAALRNGVIAGAALDVFGEEPLPGDSPLWELGNLIISPHMSGDTDGSDQMLLAQFVENFERFVNGAPMRNVVDKHKGY
jgi:phosphoglycerate dehydrogenase-like enzyme